MTSVNAEFTTLLNAKSPDFWLYASKDMPWSTSEDTPVTAEQTVEESGEPVQLMLHDIRSCALNYKSLVNRAISKTEIRKECFKEGVLENSDLHSPVFISDIRPEYIYHDHEELIYAKMSNFASPDETITSGDMRSGYEWDQWAQSGFAMNCNIEEPETHSQTWIEWALGLIGY